MKSFTLMKKSGAVIPCLMEVPESARDIIIMVHGFGSQKDCATAQMLFRRMPPAGFGVVTYDQPAHGPDEAGEELLLVENCISSLQTVDQFVADEFPDARVCYFSSSFGAYITTLYLCQFPHHGHRAFLRSAAVNMPLLMLGPPGTEMDPAYRKEFDEKGYIVSDIGPSAIRIPLEFLHGLARNDLAERFRRRIFQDTEFEMVHGEKDSTIEVSFAKTFAEQFGIPITVIPDEEHTLSDHPETPDRVADMAIAFYRRDKNGKGSR